jgi:PAS domain S-box-containing protein
VVHVSEFLTDREQAQLASHFQGSEEGLPRCLPEEESVTGMEPVFVERMMKHALLNSPESATGTTHVAQVMSPSEMEQYQALVHSNQQTVTKLPQSMKQALEDEERAIVVTTAHPPFQVVDVNHVWEGLCGYSRQEARDQPIGTLLQGPDTDTDRARQTMTKLVQEPAEQFDLRLVNYTKSGRKFYNHLQVGTMVDQDTGDHYFVGVLEEDTNRSNQNMAA